MFRRNEFLEWQQNKFNIASWHYLTYVMYL